MMEQYRSARRALNSVKGEDIGLVIYPLEQQPGRDRKHWEVLCEGQDAGQAAEIGGQPFVKR